MEKKRVRRRFLLAAVIGAVTLLVVFALAALSVTPVKYDLAVGQVAPATIKASGDVEDTVSTLAAQDAARAAVAEDPPMRKDAEARERVLENINAYFDGMAAIPETVKNAYLYAQAGTGYGYDAAEVDWESFLTDTLKGQLADLLETPEIPDAALYQAARMSEEDVEAMRGAVVTAVTDTISVGVQQEFLDTAKQGVRSKLEPQFAQAELLYLAALPVDKYLEANYIVDEEALTEAQDEAAAAVEPVYYKDGQVVVTEGEIVTGAQLAVLQALGVVGGGETDYALYISMFVYMALLLVLYGVYMAQFERELLADTRRLLMLASVAVVTAALAAAFSRVDARILTAYFGAMLACVLLSQRSALSFTVYLSLALAPICAWRDGLFSVSALEIALASLLGGVACVFALARPTHRASLISAGLAAGVVGGAVAALAELMGPAELSVPTLAADAGYALGSGLLAGVLAVGTLPLWEAVFRAATPSRLLELSNPNHPLMKRLSLEAPGTYYHSILTANLAEAGADAVGASALLCRVGAYYHDVGKLRDPMFFAENQKGENPHDGLDARESARIITEHVSCGLELARKYKLPREVQAIIAQHHGTTQVAYFYHKALEAGLEPKASQFRYPGVRPQTREAAIVMLADCVEAAVRSMGDVDMPQVREMIGRLVRERYDEGQLDEAPLSRRDLNRVAQAFALVFEGAQHERVKYPGQEQKA